MTNKKNTDYRLSTVPNFPKIPKFFGAPKIPYFASFLDDFPKNSLFSLFTNGVRARGPMAMCRS
jgi:hypothetical protein